MQTIQTIEDLKNIKEAYNQNLSKYKYQVLVCGGAGCVSSNCADVKNAVVDELSKNGLLSDVAVLETGCMGTCAVGPVMLVLPERTFYTKLTPKSPVMW